MCDNRCYDPMQPWLDERLLRRSFALQITSFHAESHFFFVMLHPPITIPIAAVQGMLSGVCTHQPADWVTGMVEQAGISPTLLTQDAARVTGEQYVKLFALLMDSLDDECLNLLSRPLRRGSFALVARSTQGAPSLAVALGRISHGFGLLLSDVSTHVVHDGTFTGLALTLRTGVQPLQNFLYELVLRVCWRLLAWLRGSKLTPRHFDFCFAEPTYVGIYGPIFPGSLRFGQQSSVVWFDKAALASPVCRDAQALQAFLTDSPANVVLPWYGNRAVSARVQTLLRRTCPVWPDLSATASSLHMSVSTLQRHLANEGTSFQSLKDGLRRDLAIVRLTTGSVPLAKLATDLGFSDSAVFQRAFKTWTGSPPGVYRRNGT